MILHEDEQSFKQLLEIVGEYYGLDAKIVEKDYWVTYALSKLKDFDRKDLIIFRGGTSLTKCYTDLKRFSEDIDLAVNKDNELSKTQIKRLITDVEKCICVNFQEIGNIQNKKGGDYRNVEYKYSSMFEEVSIDELNPSIKIETVTFLTPNPYEKRSVKSMIYDYLNETERAEFIGKYQLEPFELNVLSIKRTLLDKIVSLVRMSYLEDLSELSTKTRHLYDLHLTYDTVKKFYLDEIELSSVINLVRQDEENSRFKDQYPYEKKWSDAPIFKLIEDGILKESYIERFGKEFVYGELPDYADIICSFRKIRSHLISVDE